MRTNGIARNGTARGGRPRTNNPIEAARQIAAIRLRELREAGNTHEEIAGMFDLTPGRIQQLCTDLCGEEPSDHGLLFR
jgi:hypothetical protein